MRAGEYAGPSWWPVKLLRETSHAGVRRLGLVWLTVSAAAIVLAILEARLNWSGIPIQLGEATVGLTVYPPLFLALLLAIWFGPMWGIVPGYAAGLISGLIGGLTVPQSLIFACATPVEVLIIWGTMAITSIVFLIIPTPLAQLYTTDGATIALAATLLPVAGVFQLFDGAQAVTAGILRGAGDTRVPMIRKVAFGAAVKRMTSLPPCGRPSSRLMVYARGIAG